MPSVGRQRNPVRLDGFWWLCAQGVPLLWGGVYTHDMLPKMFHPAPPTRQVQPPMSTLTTQTGIVICTGGCERELASTNQPNLEEMLTGKIDPNPAPHFKYVTVCVNCIENGYQPPVLDDDDDLEATAAKAVVAPIFDVVPCAGCDRNLNINANQTLIEAVTTDPAVATAHRKFPNVCTDCIARGFVPPKTLRRRDIVIENCEFYVANGIGLTEAAGRENYSDRSHLDSVLRRWGRLDLTHALGALDPMQVRERS
jgi:hypothetical protein